MKKIAKKKPGDLYSEVHQSAADQLLQSVKYPFTAFERRQEFPGCSKEAVRSGGAIYEYKKSEVKKMLRDAVEFVRKNPDRKDVSIEDQIYAFGGSIVEQAKKVVDAANAAGAKYQGPAKAKMQSIVDGGIEGLAETLDDLGVYGWCPYVRVTAKQMPHINLASPRIDLTGVSIEVTATGELWFKHPWWNCYKWCTQWEKVIKCDKVGSITVSPSFNADAHATVEADRKRVVVRAEFDKLRLDFPILDKIPLEGIANEALRDKLIFVFDAGQLVATVPILQSRFTVDAVELPATASGIAIGVTVRQL
jgi:hypothetical protein